MNKLEEEKRTSQQTKELLENTHNKELAILEREHKDQLKVGTSI